MNMVEYWPFFVSEKDKKWPDMIEKIKYLEDLKSLGFKSFRSGINDYGAETDLRRGIMIERSRDKWEIRLYEEDIERVVAYVSGFSVAGKAIRSWLSKKQACDIIADIHNNLVLLSGLEKSFTIS